MQKKYSILLLISAFAYSSCGDRTSQKSTETTAVPEETRLAISISKRQLAVIEGQDTIKRYAVAVGKEGHPTPEGEFEIHQIDWNPDWTPPDSEWAEDESYKKPGEPGNPMGRARIVYQMPYTIHGTNDVGSLGEAESHGSVRMANEEVIQLAKLLMSRTGTERDDDWYDRVLADSTTMESVKLEKTIRLSNER